MKYDVPNIVVGLLNLILLALNVQFISGRPLTITAVICTAFVGGWCLSAGVFGLIRRAA